MTRPFALGLQLAKLTLGVALCGTTAAYAAEPDALAQRLIRLRAEVEQLNGDLTLLRDEQRTTLSALNAQKAELSASVERQQLAARELREKLTTKRAEQADAGLAGDSLKPQVLAALAVLRTQVAAGLPFKVDERLGEMDAFQVQVENGTLPPQRAVNRLWAFFEDEFRMTHENGVYSQTIALGEERVLAEVAKVGTMALYFNTQDGRVGQAVRGGDGWRFVVVEDKDDAARIAAYYDALRKQIRQGWFELPVAVAGGVR
ncbi:MAG: DUF3450 family protein [Xanthomonadaceae bacterium]|nr:DUF3450 family protein [Xanthomonadaceae bacterium]